MRKRYIALPLLALIPLAAACVLAQPDNRTAKGKPATVAEVDLTRYAGTWYEIARYPNSFEKNCINTTATYGLNDDGTVSVVNECTNSETGETKRAEGTARKFAPDWVPFAWGDYWILALEADYSAALVGSPDGKYLWILAREEAPKQAVIDRMLNAAREKGFATEPLVFRQ